MATRLPVGLLHIFGDGFQAESLGFRMLERPPPPDKARRRRGIRSRSAARGRRGDWFHRREITAVIRARPTDDRGDRGAAGRARGLADRRRRAVGPVIAASHEADPRIRFAAREAAP